MHTTAYFLSSLISSDRPTDDATTKAKFIMQISRGFPEKVNTIIAVLAELTKAMCMNTYTIHIVMLWYLIRIAYNRIFSGKFIENHLHHLLVSCIRYPMLFLYTMNSCLISKFHIISNASYTT